MDIDVEKYVLEWRAREAAAQQAIVDRDNERRERRRARLAENAESLERAFRKKVEEAISCISGPYNPVWLIKWFKHDFWTVNEGLILLCGFDPRDVPIDVNGNIENVLQVGSEDYFLTSKEREIRHVRRLDGLRLYSEDTQNIIGINRAKRLHMDFLIGHRSLRGLWESGSHQESRYPPEYFISWAQKKGYFIAWLDWAIENKFYVDTVSPPDLRQSADRDLSSTERNTLLVILAALCKKAGIDPLDKSSAAEIERLVDALGLRKGVTDETIKKHLVKIPGALQPRMR